MSQKMDDYRVIDPITGHKTTKRVIAGKDFEEGQKSGGWKNGAAGGYHEGKMPEILPWDRSQRNG